MSMAITTVAKYSNKVVSHGKLFVTQMMRNININYLGLRAGLLKKNSIEENKSSAWLILDRHRRKTLGWEDRGFSCFIARRCGARYCRCCRIWPWLI